MPPIPPGAAGSAAEVLRFYLTHSPPDHALWKSIEWRLFSEHEYPEPVLDLGCGDGVFAKLIFTKPLDVGIDILHGRIARARRTGAHRHVLTADATRMPFVDGYFATVFSGCAMEHVPPMREMLAEIARVLRPGGRLITTVPSGYFSDYLYFSSLLERLGLATLARRYGKLVPRLLSMVHLYHPAHWEGLLREAGLELVEARHFVPRDTTALYDKVFILGNLVQPLSWLIRGTPLHRRYVDWLHGMMARHLELDEPTGGGLMLVARKPV